MLPMSVYAESRGSCVSVSSVMTYLMEPRTERSPTISEKADSADSADPGCPDAPPDTSPGDRASPGRTERDPSRSSLNCSSLPRLRS